MAPLLIALLPTLGCTGAPEERIAADPSAALIERLPDDAALYVLVRPRDLQAAFDDLGARLRRRQDGVREPGAVLTAIAEALDLPALKQVARAAFFHRSGLDRDGVVALGLLRAPPEDILLGRGLMGSPDGVELDCPERRTTLVGAVAAPEAAVRYAEGLGRRAQVDGRHLWIDGRTPGEAAPAPARWRLPEWPTADRPLTARLSVDRLGASDQLLSLARACPHLAAASRVRRPSPSARAGCDAAWAAQPASAHRLDVRLEQGAGELSVVMALELTGPGEAALRAGLDAPGAWAIPPTAALGIRLRFDTGKARATGPAGDVEVSADHCPLHESLGPLVRWPGDDRLSGSLRTGVLGGVTAAALDLPADPEQPLSLRAALEYGRPAKAVRLGSGPLSLDLSPGEEQVVSMPVLGSDLTVRLEDDGATSRIALGLAVPAPSKAVELPEDPWRLGRIVVRPRRLDALMSALTLYAGSDWMEGWSRADLDRVEAELRLSPPRLVGALRLSWDQTR